jgi:xylulokinase
MFTLFKLIWLKENEPELWVRSKVFYCYEDLMHYKLGIVPAISWPLAGRTMLFDVNSHSWSEEILSKIDLSTEKLARPLPSGKVVGIIPDRIASDLGLNEGVKVISGGHDQTIAALGAGITKPGKAMYASGTVDCFCPAFSEQKMSKELFNGNLCCYDFPLPNTFTTVAYSLTGENIFKWFRDEFGQQEIMEAEKTDKNPFEILSGLIPEKPTDLLVLPYFTSSGTPYFDTGTKGAVIGLRLTSSRYEFMKALLEGVAFEMRLNLEIMT